MNLNAKNQIKKMKPTKIILTVIAAIAIAACHTSKMSTSSSSPAPSTTTTSPYVLLKPATGIYEPGEEELAAIREQYKEVTLDQLKEGHVIYTVGACVGCHGAQSIYQYGTEQWKTIVDDMAQRATLTDVQKDAVYKYVLAIKAKQPR